MTDPIAPEPDDTARARTAAEARAFRALVAHLQARTDVQNIDLMNLSGFCRNCLGKWLKAGADAEGLPMTDDEARDAVYGMPYAAWKAAHQAPATPEQLARFEQTRPLHARHTP
jgi:hypothetical protein